MWAQIPAFDDLHTNNLHAPWHGVGPRPTVPKHNAVARAGDGSPQVKSTQGQEKALVGNAICTVSSPQEQGDVPGLHSQNFTGVTAGCRKRKAGRVLPNSKQNGQEELFGRRSWEGRKTLLRRTCSPTHVPHIHLSVQIKGPEAQIPGIQSLEGDYVNPVFPFSLVINCIQSLEPFIQSQ